MNFYKSYLKSFYEDMFFRAVKELPALAPDGKKTKVTSDELKELMDQIENLQEN